MLLCLQAALPETAWQIQFSAFFLPSVLGPSRPGKQSARTLMRKRFLKIFERAGHDNPETTLEQVLLLLPIAEKHSKEGLPHRLAWAAASHEFPNLAFAREAVSLFLGCLHTTGNVERSLKLVAMRKESYTDSGLSDLVLCTQAPRPADAAAIAKGVVGCQAEIFPKNKYLPTIVKVYAQTFGGRRWSKEPKPRRDKGVARPSRTSKARVPTEAAFMRKREREVRGVMQESAEQRASKRRCSEFGGAVPEDDAMFVTPAIEQVREAARCRQSQKQVGPNLKAVSAAINKSKKRADGATQRRWAGRSTAKAQQATVGGQTPASSVGARADGHTSAVAHRPFVLLARESPHRDALMRCGFEAVHTWPAYARLALKSVSTSHAGMVVVPMLTDDAMTVSPHAIVCRLFGGFLTTAPWLATARIEHTKSPPEGMACRGFSSIKPLTLFVSDSVRGVLKDFYCALVVLAEEGGNLKLVKDDGTVLRGAQTYIEAHGVRSRPWLRFCALVHTGADRQCMLERGFKEPRLVQTVVEFLSTHCAVERAAKCPGRWS